MAPKHCTVDVKIEFFPIDDVKALWRVCVTDRRGVLGVTCDIGIRPRVHLLGGVRYER